MKKRRKTNWQAYPDLERLKISTLVCASPVLVPIVLGFSERSRNYIARRNDQFGPKNVRVHLVMEVQGYEVRISRARLGPLFSYVHAYHSAAHIV